MTRPRLGLTLPPDEQYLDLMAETLRHVPDYYEVAPETGWWIDEAGEIRSNGFSDLYDEWAQVKPLVAHGVSFSLGTAQPDSVRRRRVLEAVARDHARRPYLWYTDHLGSTVLGGEEITLPIALPPTEEAAARVQASLVEIQSVVPAVGFENSAFYFHLGDPQEEPAFLRSCLRQTGTHLLLDLYNLYTTALNTGLDPLRWLEDAPLERVIEIHISGGSWSEPGWLPADRTLRLDSHDAAVPEEVWRLLNVALPGCTQLRGLTLERMEGTVGADDVPLLNEELRRARRALDR